MEGAIQKSFMADGSWLGGEKRERAERSAGCPMGWPGFGPSGLGVCAPPRLAVYFYIWPSGGQANREGWMRSKVMRGIEFPIDSRQPARGSNAHPLLRARVESLLGAAENAGG